MNRFNRSDKHKTLSTQAQVAYKKETGSSYNNISTSKDKFGNEFTLKHARTPKALK